MRFVAAVAALAAACTNAELERIPTIPPYRDDKATITGELCTAPPESRLYPLRVLFVVDSSDSMRETDPPDPVTNETGRERAVRETWLRLLADDPEGVGIGIIRFSTEAQGVTPEDLDGDSLPDSYYTTSGALLITGTAQLGVTDRETSYLGALSEAYYEMRTELLRAELESLPLSRYVIIFVSDGLPDTDDSETRLDTPGNILAAVRGLKNLAELFRVGQFEFHTAYVSKGIGTGTVDEEAEDLLKRMAYVGGGSYRSFPSGESLNFLFADFNTLRRVFTLRSLGAVNLNAVTDRTQHGDYERDPDIDAGTDADADLDAEVPDAGQDAGEGDGGDADVDAAPGPTMFVDLEGDGAPSCGEPLTDTDGDGLADFMERDLGTNPLLSDTDDDGLNDRLEWKIDGLDPLDPTDSRCRPREPCNDVNLDGFCDCVADVDLNGICDCAEDSDGEEPCADDQGHDCVDRVAENGPDGYCDCPDVDADGFCDYDDRDGDGLHDCEEVYFGTSQIGADSDADGMPDSVEVRARTNPTENDEVLDGDLDQTRNGIEVLANTDPWCDDAQSRSLVSYRYEVMTDGLSDGTTCYSFQIGNITLVPTAPNEETAYPGNGWNRILVYAGEVSFDDPNAYPDYRIACVMVRYKLEGNYRNPPSGRIRLTEEDFVDANEFDADEDCIWP